MDNIKIESKLGEGSFGQVLRCIDEDHNEFVIKEQTSESNLHQDIMIQSRFRQAGSILKFTRLLMYNGHICPVMKYMEKGSLRSVLDTKNHLTESEAIWISYQLLNQISILHISNVIHHDIKTENIVLDNEGNAKLIDFGLSVYIPKIDLEKPLVNRNRNVPGTLFYMAPELINNEPYTNRIDIWALGIVAVEMVMGCVPYKRLGECKAILIVKKKEKIKYKSRQKISKEFSEFIDCCLEPDSAKRFSANELIAMPIFRDFSIGTF